MKKIWVKFRATNEERDQIRTKAEQVNLSMADFIREALTRATPWTVTDKKIESEKIRQLARIGNNLNQIARFANTHKSGADATEICRHLVSIEHELKKVF